MTTVVPTGKHRATELLEALGATAQDVADTLMKAGITGVQGDCNACPIAVYLLHSDLGATEVSVSENEIALWSGGDLAYVDTTDAVTEFITRFDDGVDFGALWKGETVIHYQAMDGSTVTVGAFEADGRIDLARAQQLAQQHAGTGVSVDLLAVRTPDGRDLVAEWEDDHAEVAR